MKHNLWNCAIEEVNEYQIYYILRRNISIRIRIPYTDFRFPISFEQCQSTISWAGLAGRVHDII